MSVEEIREQLTLALEQYDPAKHAGYLFHELRNDICEYHIILRTKNRNGWKKALVALKERINSLQRVFIGIFGIGGNDYTRVRVNALIMKFLVAVFEDLIASGCENAKDPRAIRYVKALTLATGEIPSRDANGNLVYGDGEEKILITKERLLKPFDERMDDQNEAEFSDFCRRLLPNSE